MGYKKLIIVGNGFDLAHGLKTSYWNFAKYYENTLEIQEFKNLEDETKKDPDVQLSEDDNSWYSFENWIALISKSCFNMEFKSNGDKFKSENAINKMHSCNDLFHKMSSLMMDFLQAEQTNHTIAKMSKIEEELSGDDALTISFNYTDTVKRYTDNYDYIHGNINDDHYIVFGLANNILPDLVNPPYIRFDKEVLKFELMYVRFLRNNGYSNIDFYLNELEPHLTILFSGKGGWDFPIIHSRGGNILYDYSNASEPIREFSEMYPNSMYPYYCKFAGVKELVIMGHGLKSDSLFFQMLNDHICISLEKITLYTFDGEKENELKEKIDILKSFFGDKEICIKSYK